MREKQRIKRKARQKTKGFWRVMKNAKMKWLIERESCCLKIARRWLKSEGIKGIGIVTIMLSSALVSYSYGHDESQINDILKGNLGFAVPFFAGFLGSPGTSVTDWVGHLAGTNINWGSYPTSSTHGSIGAFDSAAQSASPGNVIGLNSGTYGGTVISGCNGNQSNPVVLRAVNPGSWGSRNTTIQGSAFRLENSNWVIVGGFRFNSNGNFGVGVRSSNNIRYVDCEVNNGGTHTASTNFEVGEGCDNVTLDHIWFKDNNGSVHIVNTDNPRNFGRGIIVEYCTIELGSGTMADEHFKAGARVCYTQADTGGSEFRYNNCIGGRRNEWKWGGWRIHHNRFYNTLEMAILIRGGKELIAMYSNLIESCHRGIRMTGHNQTATNNVIYRTTQWAVQNRPGGLNAELDNDNPNFVAGGAGRCINNLIANNTIYDCGGSNRQVIELGTEAGPAGNIKPDRIWIRNNVFEIDTHNPSRCISVESGCTNTLVNGNCFDLGGTSDGSSYGAGWFDSARVNGDPSFIGTYVHRPVSGSNTINQGVIFSWTATSASSTGVWSPSSGDDYNGDFRNSGSGPDIGAIEWQEGSPPPPPPPETINRLLVSQQSNSL